MSTLLENFKGVMDQNDFKPSIYAVFQYYFFKGFLYNYTTGSKNGSKKWHSAESRINLFAHDAFGDFYQRIIIDISQKKGYFYKYDQMLCGGKPYGPT